MRAKLQKISNYFGLGLAVAGLFWLSGCGSGSGANVTTVTVSPATNTVIVSQSLTLTASVSGPSTNTSVTWACTYTTTTVTGTTSKTSSATACNTDTGNIPANSNQTTVTFTAPSKVPDQTKYPGLVITITATAAADTKKTGTATITLDSGIFVGITPVTASVPVKESLNITATLTNDLQSKGVTWLITQSAPTSTIPYPSLTTCSPTCGTITPVAGSNTATYTAPSTVPTSTTVTTTPADVTIVATAAGDTTRFTIGTITIVTGGPITFNGISPTLAPAGARQWDFYLDAPNISSASTITLQGINNPSNKFVLTSAGNQVKILFPIPTSTTTTPASTGARIRLNEQNLSAVDTYTVTVTDPAETVTTNGTPSFQLLPVRPTTVASIPDGVVQNSSLTTTPIFAFDGGYFGFSGSNAAGVFQGNSLTIDANTSTSRQLIASPSAAITSPPGLYPIAISGRATPPPAPLPYNSSVTTLAVFPDYSVSAPFVSSSLTTGTNLNAIDIDPTLGIAVVADTGGNAIQFFTIGAGTLTPLSTVTSTPAASINVPTGVSVNRNNHTVAVVNYGDQSVSVLPIPTAPPPAITPFNVSLASTISAQNATTTAYAIGVDPDTNLALVAYSNTSSINLANVGFIVNLNPGNPPPYGCINDTATTKNPGPCVFAQVTLNTGSYPQIAMVPHSHLALVTPGGSGPTTAVDVTKPSSSSSISSISVTSSIVTVTTSAAHNLNPAKPGTVLINGVIDPTTNKPSTILNGVFAVTSVLSSTSFTYTVTSTTNITGQNSTGVVYYSAPNLTYGISQTSQGVAINPITRTAAVADANATGSNGPQINLINSLDQSITSITFNATCTFYTQNCAGAPELLGTTAVAWQPFSNALVSYNSGQNQVSVSDPVSQRRYALACQSSSACATNPATTGQITLSGTGTASINVANAPGGKLNLFGGIAVDPDTNQAIVVMSGSSSISLINLGPSTTNTLKPAEITELIVPSPSANPGTIGGIPNATAAQATLTSSTDLANVLIFGAGFGAPNNTTTQVRLDGNPLPSGLPPTGNVKVMSDREIQVTIPASFLSFPHRYALDVISNGVQSNATDFIVMQAVDLSKVCSSGTPKPTAVAIADQLANGPFSPIAVVTNNGCTSISVIDINPTITSNGKTMANPNFGTVLSTPSVGASPVGVAIDQRRGLAVVGNYGDNTASIIDLTAQPQPTQKVAAVPVGTNPSGVAVNDATDVAILANTGSNNVSLIDLALLYPPSGTTAPTTLTSVSAGVDQQPIAVAIDPDRGTNNQGIAVVTALQLVSGAAPQGALDVVEIGIETPSKSTTISTGTVSATPTGVVFDPTVITGTTNNGVFYANSSGSNVISSFNPDTGAANSVTVGINPTSLGINPQTGAILTTNFLGNSVSIVDTLSSPIKTRQTLGIPGSTQFGVAIDPFTNLAVIVDQANNRVLLFPMPN